LKAKFRNDSNFLEMKEKCGRTWPRNDKVSWEAEEGDGDRNPVCKYFRKKSQKFISLSLNEFKSATNKTLQNTSLPQSKEFV